MAYDFLFDYQGAFGSNPWEAPTRRISSLVSDHMGRFGAQFGAGGQFGTTSSFAAGPDDPEVHNYMSHVLGGQRAQLGEYVRRAAGAGIKRGGMNVVGGPALDSSLHHGAMKTLAGGYADRFREAMNYNRGLKSEQYRYYTDSMNRLESLLNTQHRYLSSQADWTSRLGSLKHSDYVRELDWQRDTPFRELKLEGLKRDAEMQQLRNRWTLDDRVWEEQSRSTLRSAYESAATGVRDSWFYRNFSVPEQIGIKSAYLGFKPTSRA